MKEIKQGTLYGFDIVLKIPKNANVDKGIINEFTLQKHIKKEVDYGIEKYKDDLLLKDTGKDEVKDINWFWKILILFGISKN